MKSNLMTRLMNVLINLASVFQSACFTINSGLVINFLVLKGCFAQRVLKKNLKMFELLKYGSISSIRSDINIKLLSDQLLDHHFH